MVLSGRIIKKKEPRDKVSGYSGGKKKKGCFWEENNTHLQLREGIILGFQAAKKQTFSK